MHLLLLHPPLLSPAVWRGLAPRLRDAGHTTVVPDLRDAVLNGWWREARDVAAAACPGAEGLVAHSGAGALVPSLLQALPTARTVVLVDAVLAPLEGHHRPPSDLRDAVARTAVDGVLPPWPTWWGDEVLDELVPDADDRAALEAEAPSVPLAVLDVAVPCPAGWEPPVRGYVRLSAAYDADADDAARRGWHVHRLDGQHLDLLSRPREVADAVLRLLEPTRLPAPEYRPAP